MNLAKNPNNWMTFSIPEKVRSIGKSIFQSSKVILGESWILSISDAYIVQLSYHLSISLCSTRCLCGHLHSQYPKIVGGENYPCFTNCELNVVENIQLCLANVLKVSIWENETSFVSTLSSCQSVVFSLHLALCIFFLLRDHTECILRGEK